MCCNVFTLHYLLHKGKVTKESKRKEIAVQELDCRMIFKDLHEIQSGNSISTKWTHSSTYYS